MTDTKNDVYSFMKLTEIETLIAGNKTEVQTPRLDKFLNGDLEFHNSVLNSASNMILIVKNYKGSKKDLIYVYKDNNYSSGMLYIGKWD